jgi:Ca2+-transporting ATPase
MRQPSRSPRESVLGAGLARQVVLLGLLMASISLAAGLAADAAGEHVQTAVFVTLGLSQLGVAFGLRARVQRTWRQRGLEVAVTTAALLQLLAVTVEPLQQLLRTQPLAADSLVLLVVLSALPGLVVAAARLGRRHSAGR